MVQVISVYNVRIFLPAGSTPGSPKINQDNTFFNLLVEIPEGNLGLLQRDRQIICVSVSSSSSSLVLVLDLLFCLLEGEGKAIEDEDEGRRTRTMGREVGR